MSDDRRLKGPVIDSETAGSRYLEAGPRHHWEADVGAVRVYFGDGRIQDLGRIGRRMGAQRALIVTDTGVAEAGHLDLAQQSLASSSIVSEAFAGVTANPTAGLVDSAARRVADFRPDLIVGLGGGSSMDCAKGMNIVLTNGGSISDYWGYGRSRKPMLPSIGVPTTAGTGSEAQSFALISEDESGRKMACGDPRARFRSVVLDPDLLASVPTRVATLTWIDAVSHAVESLVSTRSNPISKTWSSRAWQLLSCELETIAGGHPDTASAGNTLLGAHLAGAAIEQSMLGATHACANPLSAAHGCIHGEAIAALLPHVVRFNGEVASHDYSTLNEIAGLEPSDDPAGALADLLADSVERLGLGSSLRDLGIARGDLAPLAEAAALEWTARFNPRPVSPAELLEIYESAY